MLLLAGCNDAQGLFGVWFLDEDGYWILKYDFKKLMLLEDHDIVRSVALASSGEVYLIVARYGETGNKQILYRIDAVGNPTEIPIDIPGFNPDSVGESASGVGAEASSQEPLELFFAKENSVIIKKGMLGKPYRVLIDSIAPSYQEIDISAQLDITASIDCQDSILVLAQDIEDSHYVAFSMKGDLSTINVTDENLVSFFEERIANEDAKRLSNIRIGSDVSDSGSVVLVAQDGVWRYRNGEGSLILSADDSVLAYPGFVTQGVLPSDGDFYIWGTDSTNPKQQDTLYYYQYVANPASPTQTLVVYSLEYNPDIQQAAAIFTGEHPGIKVVYQVGMNGNSAINIQDAIRTLNTRILAGEGPDRIVLDGLPAKNYVDQGVMLDISDVLNEAVVSQNYYDTILEASSKNGLCYAIPMRFTFPCLLGDVDTLGKIDSLDSLLNHIEGLGLDSEVLCSAPLFDELLTLSYNSIIKDGAVDRMQLAKFFENAKRFSLFDEPGFAFGALGNLDDSDREPISPALEAIIEDPRRVSISSFRTELDFGFQGAPTLGGFSSEDAMSAAIEAGITEIDVCIAADVFPSNNDKIFVPRGLTGITNNTKDVEQSKQFLRLLLSDKVQLNGYNTGLSVKLSVLSDRLNDLGFVLGGAPGGLDYAFGVPSQESLASYREMMSSLDTPVSVDGAIRDVLLVCLRDYLDGKTDLDTAVTETERKINLYYAEQ